jgi:hypothetical protein
MLSQRYFIDYESISPPYKILVLDTSSRIILIPSMAMILFGLDPGKFVRFLSGEYTRQHWDVRPTLEAV